MFSIMMGEVHVRCVTARRTQITTFTNSEDGGRGIWVEPHMAFEHEVTSWLSHRTSA